MNIRFWGTRGSIPTFNKDTQAIGGNTSCVSIVDEGVMLILDAGSGIKNLSDSEYIRHFTEFHILITHYHFDHIQGLGFFGPFFNPKIKVNIYGPAANSGELIKTLSKYLSPPLFPVRIQDFNAENYFHALPKRSLKIGHLNVESSYVCHPGPTLGYRISNKKHTVTYLPDHEVQLGIIDHQVKSNDWTSGYALAENTDLLIHDAQYDADQYQSKIGWGHSSYPQAIDFAKQCKAKRLYFFHHDPMHTDHKLQELLNTYMKKDDQNLEGTLAKEGDSITLDDL